VPDLPAVLRLFEAARQGPFTLSAFEFFTDRAAARVRRHRGLTPPFAVEGGCYVLIEVEATHRDAVEQWAAGLFERELVSDGVLAQNGTQAKALWQLRESISESLSATGVLHKNDVALPVAALAPFCAAFEALFAERYPGWEVVLFGHIGDGNLHINVMKPDALAREEFFARTGEADHALFALVRDHGGSISAEHGVGLLKKPYLGYSRSPEELALLRAVKVVFDPLGILNPGKIIDV
jgi:FAD/FMN-containing dehydrogenase